MSKLIIITLCIVISTYATLAEGLSKIDSLISVVETNASDTIKAKAMGDLAWEYMYSNPDTAFILAEREYELGESLIESGETYLGKKQMSHSYITQGVYFYLKGNYPNALEYYHKALKLVEEIGARKGMAVINNNIGGIYYEQGDWETALKYQLKGLQIQVKIYEDDPSNDNKGILSRAYNNMGVIYHERGDVVSDSSHQNFHYDEAIKYYLKAIGLAEAIGHENTLGSTYSNLGMLYEETGKYAEALSNYEKAIATTLEVGNKEGYAFSHIQLGSLHARLEKYVESAEYLNTGLELAREYGSLPLMRSAYRDLHIMYERKKDFEQSLHFYKLFTSAEDSLFNEQKSKDIGKIEATHEFELAEKEKKRAKEEQAALALAAMTRRDNLQYSGILIFIVLLFAAVFMLGKISIPIRLAEGMIFFSFLLFFEFTLVMLDPYIEQYSSGAPAIKLAFNAVLAGLIFPLHSFFESRLKSKLVK